ncbi:MAG: hypothetical protein ABMA13_03275 [Chthoniobacteraceae bacterium]
MDILAITLIALGAITAAVGGIMLLIAAFRESVLWGLAYLLLPLAGLVFIVMHWDKSRRGFLLNLAGVCVVIAGFFSSPMLQKSIASGVTASVPKNLPISIPMLEKKKPEDLNARIAEQRTAIDTMEAQFEQDGVTLAQQYRALDARRSAFKPEDAAGVTAYNAEAAAYQQANAAHKQLRQQIDAAQQELSGLLDERSRLKAIAPKGPPGKKQTARN